MIPEQDFAGRQVSGERDEQQDFYAFCPLTREVDGVDGLLLVLADGMGGYAGGSLASRLVVEAFIENFCYSRGGIGQRLLSSLRASERRLQEEIARLDERLAKMGSTLIGALCTHELLHWVSVGDSGLFLYRDNTVRRLNADHSMVPVLAARAERGEITWEEAAKHRDRHALRSALGNRKLELFELSDPPVSLQKGDIVFAASDGLASVAPEDLMDKLEMYAHKSADAIASALLIAVNEARKKKQDNATVAVIRPQGKV